MSTDAAGTPTPAKDGTGDGGTPETAKDDSGQVTVSAQFKDEALRVWKPAAEKVRTLEQQLAEERSRSEELARRAYGGGQTATDPRAALVAHLQEQAPYDMLAQATLINMQDTAIARADAWLLGQLVHIPDSKRDKVALLVRQSGYQMTPEQALSVVTDPDAMTLNERLAELEAENTRLKGAKSNGISPAAVSPATANQDDGSEKESIKRSEYTATLRAAQQPGATEAQLAAARTLMQAVGTNKTKLLPD